MQDGQSEGPDRFEEAVAFVRTQGGATASLLQRKMAMGYPKAVALIQRMEAEGIVSKPDHLGKREVFIKPGETLESWRAGRSGGSAGPDAGGYIPGGADRDLIDDDDQGEPEGDPDPAGDVHATKNVQAPGSNLLSGKEIMAFVERIERAQKQVEQDNAFVKEIYAELKGRGYDPRPIRALIKLRKKSPSQRDEDDSIMELYRMAVGMDNDMPLFRHVQNMGEDKLAKEAVTETLKAMVPLDGEITIKVGRGQRMRIYRTKEGVFTETVDDLPEPSAHKPSVVAQPDIPVPDLDEGGARELGAQARRDDEPIVANPFPWDHANRRHWDEGWRHEDGGDGMGPA